MPSREQVLLADIRELVARPSVSSASPDWDQSNLAVINYLAERFAAQGFRVDVQAIDTPGKANLVATLGAGEGGLSARRPAKRVCPLATPRGRVSKQIPATI